MNRTRTRALLAAAALGAATIAVPIAAAAQSPTVITVENGLTCKKAYPALEMVTGPVDGAHGTLSYSGNTLTYDLFPGWTLDLCLKGANNVEYTAGITGSGTISLSIPNAISHIGFRLDFEEPSDDDGTDDDGDTDGTDDDGETDGTDDDGDTDGTDGTDDDGETDGTDDDGVSNDDGETDGTDDDGDSNDDGETDGTDDDGTDDGGTDDDGTEVLPGGEVAPVDGGDGDATDGDDGRKTAEVPVEVLPATLDSRLPNTGSDVPALLAAAALALGLGGSALVRTRRRATSA